MAAEKMGRRLVFSALLSLERMRAVDSRSKRRRGHWLRVLAPIVVLPLVAAACGDDDTVATGDTSAPVTTAAAPEPTPTPSTTETPGEFEPVGTDLTTPLPAGDVARGEQLFDAPSGVGLGCASCHTFADASLRADPSLLAQQGPAR